MVHIRFVICFNKCVYRIIGMYRWYPNYLNKNHFHDMQTFLHVNRVLNFVKSVYQTVCSICAEAFPFKIRVRYIQTQTLSFSFYFEIIIVKMLYLFSIHFIFLFLYIFIFFYSKFDYLKSNFFIYFMQFKCLLFGFYFIFYSIWYIDTGIYIIYVYIYVYNPQLWPFHFLITFVLLSYLKILNLDFSNHPSAILVEL